MNYNHIIKTETLTQNTIIDYNEGFTKIEFFPPYGNTKVIKINNMLELYPQQWYKIENMPYVKISSNISVQVPAGNSVVVIKHFYVKQE